MTDMNWHEEEERVEMVIKKMKKRIEDLEKEVGQVRNDVINIRKHFWDEVNINLSNPDDIIETHFTLKQQAEVLSERERRYRLSVSALKSLSRSVSSPYFGRIDFAEGGIENPEQIYIGTSSFRDEKNDIFLVYDWRAPISSLYYDYGPGPATYQAPLGDISGTISLKRQFTIRDGHIRFMFDTGVTIGDELLMQVLSRHSDAEMKSIVATIQKEQNRIIRNDRSRLLVVEGAAGSGKTSAALQRVAYLLYKHRQSLHADQMVLFSPNPLFNSYVSTVLPELGEENMQQTTFQEYLDYRLGSEFTLEDSFSQIEYMLTLVNDPGYEARAAGISYKSSVEFLNVIRSYVKLLEHEGMFFLPVKFRGRVIVSAKNISKRFYSFDSSIRLANRIELCRKWLLRKLSIFAESEMKEEWVEEEINLLDPDDYHRSYKQLRRAKRGKGVSFDDYETEKNLLSQMVIRKHLKPIRAWIKQLQFVNTHALYRQMFANETLFTKIVGDVATPKEWPLICAQTIEKLDRLELAAEDATPFLYLREYVQGLHTNTSVRHVIIDEVQDYSPVQLEFLKRLFPRSRMTLLGDLNQAIYTHESAFEKPAFLSGLYGVEQTEIIRLQKSYRSTKEIVEFTRGMVQNGGDIISFNRSGDKPTVQVVSSWGQRMDAIAKDIESLQMNGYESIAVICKTMEESTDAYCELHVFLELRLVTKFTPTFEKGTVVIPAYLAKGVEFDAVIIYDGSKDQYSRENERKLFYTACTRAMHKLHIFALGGPSPFIMEQDASTYMFLGSQ